FFDMTRGRPPAQHTFILLHETSCRITVQLVAKPTMHRHEAAVCEKLRIVFRISRLKEKRVTIKSTGHKSVAAVRAAVHRPEHVTSALGAQPVDTSPDETFRDCRIVDAFEVAELAVYAAGRIDKFWIDRRRDASR